VQDFGKPNIGQKRIYTFGYSEHGALGLPNLIKPSQPHQKRMQFMWKPVRNAFSQYVDVINVAAGHGFTLLAVKPKNGISPVFGCGFNNFSQLGEKNCVDIVTVIEYFINPTWFASGHQAVRAEAPLEILLSIVPITLPKLKNSRVKGIAGGLGHSVVSFEEQGLLTFGDNSKGQCGRRIIADENYFGSKYVHKIPPFGSGVENDVIKIAARFHSTYVYIY